VMTGETLFEKTRRYVPKTWKIMSDAKRKNASRIHAFKKSSKFFWNSASAEFHEKWVVGYGHASVAEHAVLHIAIENASRVAMEAIESNRLASYTEKSTRYQKWEADSFYTPPELEESPQGEEYTNTCKMLFRAYANSLAPVRALVQKTSPRRENESEEAWDRRIRSQYVDSCRYLLPAASLANVGITANARVLENAIRKWRSHGLEEVRQIGEAVKQAAQAEAPTLVKYAEPQEYLQKTSQQLGTLAKEKTPTQPETERCTLLHYDPEGEKRILTAALYRFGGFTYAQALAALPTLGADTVADALLQPLGRFDQPLRELEHCSYTFEIVLDQGAYAEFKRHRMMTQTPQLQTAALGYFTPPRLQEAGLESAYRQAMETAAETWQKLEERNPLVAQYIVPNGFYRRVLATFNLRQAFAFCQLRSAPNAHFAIRRVAQGIAQEIQRVHPLLAGYMKLHEATQ